jgi:ribosome-associated protein
MVMAIEGLELAKACAKAAEDMKAESVRVWDLRGLSNLTDYMVVCSGSSQPHLRAVLREVEHKVGEEHDSHPANSEGKADTRWVVLDYIDVMVHVMDTELREYYGLEELWADAKEVTWS